MKLDTVIAERKTKTIYRDGDCCVKVFNSTFSKADILNEALNNARVEDVGLYVPKILEVTTIDGKWAIVSEFIEGTTLSHLMRDNPEKKEEYLDLLVETQMQIHSKHSPLLSRLKDKMNRKILGIHLTNLQVPDIRYAENGAKALEVMAQWKPDLVFTDMWMPEMDGTQLAEAMRRDRALAEIPVVAVTADVDVGATYDMSLFAKILSKPVTTAKLKALFGVE